MIRLRWPGLVHDESGAPVYAPPTARGRELLDRYGLAGYQGRWARGTWRTVLGTLDLLDRVPWNPAESGAPLRVLDVGSSHWRYFGALAAWLRARGARGAQVTGVELDAFRLYRNLRTPAALARYYSRVSGEGLGEVRYVAGDVRRFEGEASLVTWFFPFLFEGTVRAWGLPASELRPVELARAVLGRLSGGGHCVFVNQGESEFDALERVIGEAAPHAARVWSERMEQSLHAADHPLFVSLWRTAGL